MRNSEEFVCTLYLLRGSPQDILLSFDVTSLFTRVPLREAIILLNRRLDEGNVNFFRRVLTSSFFCLKWQFYEQSEGVATGLPLSPVIANFCMEAFEEEALKMAAHIPVCWFRYVADILMICPHGCEKLNDFNFIHTNTQFTMETERHGHMAFLDIDVYRRHDGSLGHRVYRKPTDADLYLSATCHHHPANKQAVLSILAHRVKAICYPSSQLQELKFLRQTFPNKGYSERRIHEALNSRTGASPQRNEVPASLAFLLFVGATFSGISRALSEQQDGWSPTKEAVRLSSTRYG